MIIILISHLIGFLQLLQLNTYHLIYFVKVTSTTCLWGILILKLSFVMWISFSLNCYLCQIIISSCRVFFSLILFIYFCFVVELSPT